MELFDFLVIFLIVCAAAAVIVYALTSSNSKRERAIARSPAGAGVEPGDSMAEIQTKNYNYHCVIEAARIFGDIRHQDQMIPILTEQQRKDVDNFLADFYGRNQ